MKDPRGRTWKMSDTITLPKKSRRLKEKEEEKVKRQPPYHVILLNDDDHSYDYVIRMLQEFAVAPEFFSDGKRTLRECCEQALAEGVGHRPQHESHALA